jgi:hypothetical protein
MTRRSSGPARALVPPVGDDWQDDEAEREAVAGQDEEAGEEEAAEDQGGTVSVDLDESDDILDTPVVAAARPGTRRAAGNARRQLEEYWEKRRMARELEDFEDFEV